MSKHRSASSTSEGVIGRTRPPSIQESSLRRPLRLVIQKNMFAMKFPSRQKMCHRARPTPTIRGTVRMWVLYGRVVIPWWVPKRLHQLYIWSDLQSLEAREFWSQVVSCIWGARLTRHVDDEKTRCTQYCKVCHHRRRSFVSLYLCLEEIIPVFKNISISFRSIFRPCQSHSLLRSIVQISRRALHVVSNPPERSMRTEYVTIIIWNSPHRLVR